MEHPKQSRVLKWSLIIGIAIVLNLFFNYALYLVFPEPEYQNFCPEKQLVSPPTTQKACLSVGGQWIENTYPVDPTIQTTSPTKPTLVGYCNPEFTCGNNYQNELKEYNRNIFLSLIVLGVVVLALGFFLKVTDTVTIALALGGVLSLIIASMRYWSFADNILKVIILGIALVVLITIGVKKSQN